MSTLEPDDVGPAVGGHLRASDSDRDQVTRLLNAAFAEGRLTPDEHATRLQSALSAQTFDDLVPLTRDLVAFDSPAPQTWSTPSTTLATPADPELIVTVFGGTTRKGLWRARRHLSVLTLFGGTELDFTQAEFTDNVCQISVFCLFGGVDVKVADGMQVRNECVAIFGGADSRVPAARPGAPSVIVKGFVGFGGVDVKVPKAKSFG